MSSTESKMMWAAVVLSLLLVLALGTLAVYSVIGQDDDDATSDEDEPAATVDDVETEGEGGSPASPGLQASEFEPPVTVDCGRADDPNQGYAVVITNEGPATLDYLVSIELTVAGARPLLTAADIPALGPGERRTVAVGAAGRRITACSVAAVQSDRRVLLANR